jgi:hypothetical protein
MCRNELAEYLMECKHKTDSEGNPLMTYPKNYESIANAMDREDLTSAKDK